MSTFKKISELSASDRTKLKGYWEELWGSEYANALITDFKMDKKEASKKSYNVKIGKDLTNESAPMLDVIQKIENDDPLVVDYLTKAYGYQWDRIKDMLLDVSQYEQTYPVWQKLNNYVKNNEQVSDFDFEDITNDQESQAI